jgi:hypothetical protein
MKLGKNPLLSRSILAFVGLSSGVGLCRGQSVPPPPPVPVEQGEIHRLKLDLTHLLDMERWKEMTPEALEKATAHPDFSDSPYLVWSEDGRERAVFPMQPYRNIRVELSFTADAIPLTQVEVLFRQGVVSQVSFTMSAGGTATAAADHLGALRHWAESKFGSQSTKERLTSGWVAYKDLTREKWSSAAGAALLESGGAPATLTLVAAGPVPDFVSRTLPRQAGPMVRDPVTGAPQAEKLSAIARLDQVLGNGRPWDVTQDQLESGFPVLPGVSKMRAFGWSTKDRASARFSRKPFSNIEQDLLLFEDGLPVEETLVEFTAGKLSRISISVLNRGDSGAVTAERFQRAYKLAGQALGKLMGVTPRSHRVQGKTVSAVEGWMWNNEHSIAVLEHNSEALRGEVEFLRLRIAPAALKNELLFVSKIGGPKSRADLLRNRQVDERLGDVMLDNIVMVDQGEKGYCVAASCQRIFNYMGIACDQHELATLLQTSADEGTSIRTMHEALSKVDAHYGTTFKVLKARGTLGKMSETEFRRVQRAKIYDLAKTYIDQGFPLLWAVQIADPNSAGLPPGPRPPGMLPPRFRPPGMPIIGGEPAVATSGHMRLIIGYNPGTWSLIYSDSWGQGHEKKVMPLSDAEAITDAVFVMEGRN